MKWNLEIDSTGLEEIIGNLSMKINAAEAIQEAIQNGSCTGETWADGLGYILFSIDESIKELSQLHIKSVEKYRLTS